jgi:ribosomal protein S18 acetylase RimI-like enzyme
LPSPVRWQTFKKKTNLKMKIRKAELSDTEVIATYLMLAMEDTIYKFICKKNYEDAYKLVLHFVTQENNQYSYQNCLVVEGNSKIIAAINYYEGEKFIELRKPILNYIRANFNIDFNPEEEIKSGEYYIDTLGVAPDMQGKGIATKLLQFLIDKYVTKNKNKLGLLVDEKNPNAKKLYVKLGFESMGKKNWLVKKWNIYN